ncbi:MAG: hypothetical protein UT55_C0013G0003 [Candidatus Peregrinibacteria bacterium GW2011_GWE2_39_6]|nr:MAG: hypothetical protein UT36_C0001G0028 [Candidatus Peregrinibacteria bacterium GW2011_GWF2_39_17]KKR26236.1 MAG: hypothetical protein UT55_C0013G0003 [Candidatus Peregrinibacteria bacterium GW2011_GWE2_39_6]HCW32370.1 hypothetical protein [Candidatus Peregrinibacteria bacterium]
MSTDEISPLTDIAVPHANDPNLALGRKEDHRVVDGTPGIAEMTHPSQEPNLVNTVTTAVARTVETKFSKPTTPHSYADWRSLLSAPEIIPGLGPSQLEIEVKNLPHIKPLLESGQTLDQALITLRLPEYRDFWATLTRDPVYLGKIRPLLLLYEARFIDRIQGIPYLLEKIARNSTEALSFVGTESFPGICFKIDVVGSTAAQQDANLAEKFRETMGILSTKLIEALRYYPEIQLVKSAGDELIFVSRLQNDDPTNRNNLQGRVVDFLSTLLRDFITRAEIALHVGISQISNIEITITNNGKLTVGGAASKEADLAQKWHKQHAQHAAAYFNSKTSPSPQALPLELKDKAEITLPTPPTLSAMRFRNSSTNPKITQKRYEKLLDDMSLLASCSINPYALLNETVQGQWGTCVYLKLNKEAENPNPTTLLNWDEQLHTTAKQYGGTVFYEADGGDAMVLFGALGNDTLHQSQRAVSFAANIIKYLPQKVASGITYGPFAFRLMSGKGADLHADTANRAARYATAQISGQLRLDHDTALALKNSHYTLHDEQEIKGVTLPGLPPQTITTCTELQEQTTPDALYGRLQDLERLKSAIKGIENAKIPKGQIDIVGAPGIGVTAFVRGAMHLLGTHRNTLAVSVNGEYGPRLEALHRPYGALAKILKSIFPTQDDFIKWLYGASNSGKKQSLQVAGTDFEIWQNLYMALFSPGETTTRILDKPEVAKDLFKKILYRVAENHRLILACEDIAHIDSASYEILHELIQEPGPVRNLILLVLVSTQEKPPSQDSNRLTSFPLGGVNQKAAFQIVAHELGLDDTFQFTGETASYIETYLSTIRDEQGRYIPSVVREAAIRLKEANFINQQHQFNTDLTLAPPKKTMREIIEARMERLSPGALKTLRIVGIFESLPAAFSHSLTKKTNLEILQKNGAKPIPDELFNDQPPILIKTANSIRFNQRLFLEMVREKSPIVDKESEAILAAIPEAITKRDIPIETAMVVCKNLKTIPREIAEVLTDSIIKIPVNQAAYAEQVSKTFIDLCVPLIAPDSPPELLKAAGRIYIQNIRMSLELDLPYPLIQKRLQAAKNLQIHDTALLVELAELECEAAFKANNLSNLEGATNKFPTFTSDSGNPAQKKARALYQYYQAAADYRISFTGKNLQQRISNMENRSTKAIARLQGMLHLDLDDKRAIAKARRLEFLADSVRTMDLPMFREQVEVVQRMESHPGDPNYYSMDLDLAAHLTEIKRYQTQLELYLAQAENIEESHLTMSEILNLRLKLVHSLGLTGNYEKALTEADSGLNEANVHGNMKLLANFILKKIQISMLAGEHKQRHITSDFSNPETARGLREAFEHTLEATQNYSELLHLASILPVETIDNAHLEYIDNLIVQLRIARKNIKAMDPPKSITALLSETLALKEIIGNIAKRNNNLFNSKGIEIAVLDQEYQLTLAQFSGDF